MITTLRNALLGAVFAVSLGAGAEAAEAPDYFMADPSLHMTRDADGVLVVEMNTNGGPLKFSARQHASFVDVFYAISRDRDNKVVILTGAGGEWMPDIDFASFGNVADPDVWSRVHDEGSQILENIANIRVPVICAVEGKAWVHTEYCLLANVIVAGEGATFSDVPHFKAGIVPGDGIYTVWSAYIGPGRAQAMLLNPKPMTAEEAHTLGVVAEVTPNGGALTRARELARSWLAAPELSRRYTRDRFVAPLKERLVVDVGPALVIEGASAAALVKQIQAKAAQPKQP